MSLFHQHKSTEKSVTALPRNTQGDEGIKHVNRVSHLVVGRLNDNGEMGPSYQQFCEPRSTTSGKYVSAQILLLYVVGMIDGDFRNLAAVKFYLIVVR